MRGSVLLVVASLGLATIVSMLLWVARKITWRRPTPFLRQLEAVSGAPERSGPASGISRLDPLNSDDSSDPAGDTAAGPSPDEPAVSER